MKMQSQTFSRAGYDVRTLPGSPDAAVLVQEIRDVSRARYPVQDKNHQVCS